MIHPATELRFKSPEIGYGVFATQPILRGTIVWTLCSLDRRVSENDRSALGPASRRELELYAYIDSDGDSILCWDHGRYVNHSCEPSMLSVGFEHEIAIRDLAVGEELTCDYGTLNLLSPLACSCGSADCRRVIGGDELNNTDLATHIDIRVADALGAAAGVDQPLVAYMQNPELFLLVCNGAAGAPSVRLCATK
jgi:uncharacterized protein